jgi:glutamyl-tRNA reductase
MNSPKRFSQPGNDPFAGRDESTGRPADEPPARLETDEAIHQPRHPGRDPQVSIFAESDTELVSPGRKLVVVGFTHQTAPLAVRARFAVARDDLPPLARRFKALPGVSGCALLATCNRLEAYLEIRSEAEAEAAFVDLVGGRDLEGRALLARSLMVHGRTEAVRHLFRVASGLDSMVLGDAQILGQAKEAYRTACQHGTAGPMLHKVFHAAFRCAKAVVSQTDLGTGAQSVAGAAVSLLAERMGGLRDKDFLLVGVNEMTEAAGKRLVKAQAARLLLCNRTAERGGDLAASLPAEQVAWSGLLDAIGRVDAVVTCTSASEPILTRPDLLRVAAARPGHRLTVVDLAVPPDVQPLRDDGTVAAAAAMARDGLAILDLEDIGAYQQRIEDRRCQATAAGDAIVTAQVAAFDEWLRNQSLGPKMDRLRQESERSLTRELERLAEGLTGSERDRLEQFGEILIKRFLGAYRRVEEEE